MMPLLLRFQRIFHFVLKSCSVERDRGCATQLRYLIDVRWFYCITVVGMSENNAAGLNHVHEKVCVVNAVLGRLFRAIVISAVFPDICDRRVQISQMRPSLLRCVLCQSLFLCN